MKVLNRFLLGWMAALVVSLLSGCSNEEQLDHDGVSGGGTPLSINITNTLISKLGGGDF